MLAWRLAGSKLCNLPGFARQIAGRSELRSAQRSFKRLGDLKRLQKRGYNLDLLDESGSASIKPVIQMLAEGKPLPARMRDHPLVGDYDGCRECHISPDWLLVYEIWQEELILYLMRTGTHSDLF